MHIIEIPVIWPKYRHTHTHTQTRTTYTNTYASIHFNHKHLNKHEKQVQTHQQAQSQPHGHTQCGQQPCKNTHKHEHRHNHMCVSEESVSAPTCVGRVHMGVGERRETESGRGGVRKGTGEALFDMHDHGGTQREKSNTRNRPKMTAKTTVTVQQKSTIII